MLGKHRDLAISCGEYTHRVHRDIVCSQSEVLAAMCHGQFMVRVPKQPLPLKLTKSRRPEPDILNYRTTPKQLTLWFSTSITRAMRLLGPIT